MNGILVMFAVLGIAMTALADDAPRAKISPQTYRRTVFLGDSITDGNTYPALVRDALADARLPTMIAINAGIGGDTAAGMRKRLDRDVLAFHPTLVTLSCGANDCFRPVPAAEFESDVRAIAERLRREHVPLIILTPCILGPRHERERKPLAEYETILRKIASEYELRVAEVNQRQADDQKAGQRQLAADDLHPNYQGQRMIARAVLDAMGYSDIKVPPRVHNQPLPGLISTWRIRPLAPAGLPLTDQKIRELKPDDSWLTVTLPELQPAPDADKEDDRWLDDYRQLGVCISLCQRAAKSNQFVGVATVHADAVKKVQFHTGADLSAVWLNGKMIYKSEEFRGWHPGRESVDGELKAGNNTVVIQTGQVFFLSVTDGPMWP